MNFHEVLIWIVFLAAIFLVACADRQSQSEIEIVTIRFAIRDYQQAQYEGLVESFEETNPDIHVKLVFRDEILKQDSSSGVITVSSDDDLTLAAAADVFTPLNPQNAAELGALLDLTPFIEADETFDEADFYPGLLEQGQWNGGIWGIPYEAILTLIYFNKDLFDESGIDYPKIGWSWDDFLATSKALTLREGNTVSQWGFVDPQFFSPLYFVQGRTGPMFDPQADPPTASLKDLDVITAVRWYTDMFLVHEVTAQLPYLDAEALISNGQVAMWSEFIGRGEQRRSQMNLGVLPFPVDVADDLSTPFSLVRTYAISAGTVNPQAAWRWLDFISRQANDWSNYGNSPSSLPARHSVSEAGSFWDAINEELETTLRYAVDHAFVPVNGKGFSTAIESILAEEKSVETALADAQAEAETAIATRLAEQTHVTVVPPIVIMQPEAESEVSTTAVTIEFHTFSHQLPTYRALADEFQAANPNLLVDLKPLNIADDYVNLSSIAAKADCFQWSPGFDEVGVTTVLSLEPFFDSDPTISPEDFFPTALESFTFQGGLRGLPSEITVSVIAFNKDMFDAAGVAYPVLDWTRDDFLTTAVALTQEADETKQYGFVPDLYEPNDLLDFIIQFSGDELIDEALDPAAMRFTNPKTVEAVRWYTSLTTDYEVKPILLTNADSDAGLGEFQKRENLINNGRAAMWSRSGQFAGGIGVVVSGMDERPGNMGIVPLPTASDGYRHGGYKTTSGYYISAAAEVPQACWQWISFLTEQPNVGTGLPARQATAISAAYQQHVGAGQAQAYLHTINNTVQPSFFHAFTDQPWLNISLFWLSDAYDQIMNEDLSIEIALEYAQVKADLFRACVITNDAFIDQQEIRTCYDSFTTDVSR